jgi:pSer/pThr/pTyr-binding forkhead associated (FHA) protein
MSNDDTVPDKSIPTVDELPKNARRHGLLTCTSGVDVGPIEVVDSVVLGTDVSLATVAVTGADVSPIHARVWSTAAGAFLLEDLGSEAGTFVNEVRVQRRTLILGDRIRLGAGLIFEFTF